MKWNISNFTVYTLIPGERDHVPHDCLDLQIDGVCPTCKAKFEAR